MSDPQTQLAPTQARPMAKTHTIKAMFEAAKGKLMEVVPKHVSADRLMRVALMTISRQPTLANCSPESLLGAFMQAGQYGLEVGGALGEAYLVPYRNNRNGTSEAQFIMGYRGMILLARRSGEISTIHADVVRDGDAYSPPEFTIDEKGPRITFSHKHTAPATANIIAAYAVVTFKDNGYQLDVMTRDELDGIRARSKASSSGPWVTDFAEMVEQRPLGDGLRRDGEEDRDPPTRQAVAPHARGCRCNRAERPQRVRRHDRRGCCSGRRRGPGR
jgi:recombination protein RecT